MLETGAVALGRRVAPRCATTPRSRGRTWAHDAPSIAAIGAKALYLLYVWLASAIVASYLSDRKGYGEKAGLAHRPAAQRPRSPDLARVAGASPDSRWKLQGAFGSGGKTVAEARAERADADGERGGS